tara:strand:+ start:404 stop:919 length:516 start_codon:yes stop_codon:yes gene_type:complete
MGTLKLSITENIDLTYGGYEYNYTTSGDSDDLEITDVNAYNAQTLVIGTAFTQIAKFENGATPGMGLYDKQKVKYIRLRPTTSSRTLTVQLSDATNNKQANYFCSTGQAIYFVHSGTDGFVFDVNSSTTSAAADVVQGTQNITGLAASADEIQIKSSGASTSVDILIAYNL